MKLLNEKLTDLRRALDHEASEAEKKVLNWLLLKDSRRLDKGRNGKKRLEEARDRRGAGHG